MYVGPIMGEIVLEIIPQNANETQEILDLIQQFIDLSHGDDFLKFWNARIS